MMKGMSSIRPDEIKVEHDRSYLAGHATDSKETLRFCGSCSTFYVGRRASLVPDPRPFVARFLFTTYLSGLRWSQV